MDTKNCPCVYMQSCLPVLALSEVLHGPKCNQRDSKNTICTTVLNIFWKMNYPTTHFLLKFFSSNLNCLHPIMSLSLTPPKKRVSKNYNWQTHEECGILLLQYYSILIVIWKSCLKRFVILHKVNGLYMYIQNKWFLVIYNSDLHVNLNFTTADLPYTLVPGLNAMHDDEIQNTVTFYI